MSWLSNFNPLEVIRKLKVRENSLAIWKNDYMTMDQAFACADDLNKKAENYNLISGWWLATAWYLNITEDDLTKTMRDLNLFNTAKTYLIDRALKVTKYFDEGC